MTRSAARSSGDMTAGTGHAGQQKLHLLSLLTRVGGSEERTVPANRKTNSSLAPLAMAANDPEEPPVGPREARCGNT